MISLNNFIFYVVDTETTHLDPQIGDVIELSFHRINDDIQKTWCLKPSNVAGIDPGALRVNGHKLEDITHQTKIGKETYLLPDKALVEIENWIMEDGEMSENRILVGQNVGFDRNYLFYLWKKCQAEGNFPFGRKMIDTMQIELIMSILEITQNDSFSLAALTKKYGIKNTKAHTAAADVTATKEVLEKQLELLKSKLKT